jgi:hypothetical protein
MDHMHIAVVPILLGRGVRLWDELEGLEKDYQVEATSSPSGITAVTFTRTGPSTASVDNPSAREGLGTVLYISVQVTSQMLIEATWTVTS